MLQKTNININFAQGLDTKTDPYQVSPGKFLSLQNTIFNKGGLLQKRNGYAALTALSNASSTFLTTFNGNLTAVGNTINAYNTGSQAWGAKGTIQPMEVSTLSLIRNSINQTQCDSAVSPNGLVCTVYTETNAGTTSYKYAIADSTTGQNVVAPKAIPVSSGTVTGSPRVFILVNTFVIVFTNVITATSHLQYIAVSTANPLVVTANADIAAAYTSATTLSWDGVVVNNNLYVGYNTTSGGQSIKVTYLSVNQAINGGAPVAAVTFASRIATMMTLTADVINPASPVVYVSFYDAGGSTGYSLAVDQNLNTIMTPTQFIASGTYLNLASSANNGVVTIFGEVSNNYSYDSAIPSHFVNANTVTAPATVTTGTVGSVYVVQRSVGLASKAVLINGTIYFLSAYQSSYQPTYFLINGSTSTSAAPVVVGKLAYQNGGGYLTLGLPSLQASNGNVAQVAYLFKDLIAAVNKNTNIPTGSQTAGIYSQTGVNLGSFTIGTLGIDTAEIGNDLHISGGFLWMYDGYLPVEHNFFVYPDNIEATWSATGGAIVAKPDGATNTSAYYYQVTYEWTDNQGNAFRSAPSIPVAVTTTGAGTTGSITVNIPTLRLTYKTANPAKIVVYRWSVAQQVYYQVTSLTSAQINSTTTDSIAYVDTLADATILGNNILYTTGGVVEDVNAPASNLFTLFDTRFWLVDAEDPNLLWYSKQVIESTPVEMSDLFTFYVAPTVGAQGSTGPITALSVMDDKLIIFKKNAIYYINGTGPDNTGANNNFSEPIFVTSTVGCANQQSIVFMPQGLMFQSDKGIWLLGRDLSTKYIGDAVEEFSEGLVQSALCVPETNQVRFTLDTGITLMYDYYYSQWGTFSDVPAISSCIFQGLHTYLNDSGAVFQESPNVYLDGSNPVLMSFTTSWFNLAGLQGYQRAYEFFLLGTYFSPHKLFLQIAYDYNSSPTQSTLIQPTNYAAAYGVDSPYGQGSPYGGPGNIEAWRVFLAQQRCSSFQIQFNEIYDPSFGAPAGQGLTLSGLNLVYAVKKGWRTQANAHSAGGGTNRG